MNAIAKRLLLTGLFLAAALQASFLALAGSPPPIEAFTRLPDLFDARLSPDGERLAVLMPVDGKKTLVVVSARKDGGIKPQMVQGGDWDFSLVLWKSSHELVALLSQTRRPNGSQPVRYAEMIRFDTETQKVRRIVPARSFNVVDTMPQDPENILVEADGLKKLSLYNDAMSLVSKGPGYVNRWYLDRDHKPRAAESSRDEKTQYYTIQDDDGFTKFQTVDRISGPRFGVIGVADDPTHLIVLSDHGTGFIAAYDYDPATQSFGRTLASYEGGDIGGPIYWGNRPVGFVAPEVTYFAPDAAALKSLVDKALPDMRNIIVNVTPDRRFALVRSSSADRPTALYRLTLGEKKKLDLIGLDYPELEGRVVATVKKVQYAARDGQKIEAILTMPLDQNGPLPFVVLPHGGPTSHDAAVFDYRAQFLASRGYGVLQPNFRGSDSYGTAFMRAGFGQWGGIMQNDIDDGTKWLVDQHLAAAGRICIVGQGYGGYAALYAATSRPDLYRCAAAFSPVTDLGDFIHRREYFDYKDPATRTFGKTGTDPDEVSPTHHADKIAIPILIAHGEEDYNVPVEQTRTMEAAMKKAGKPVEVVYYKDENNFLSLASTRKDFFSRLEAFLGRNIGTAAAN